MTGKYQAYSEYRDSNIEVIGDVPKDWVIGRLKQIVDQNRQITYGIVQAGPNKKDGVAYIRPADMTDEDGVKSFDELLRTTPKIAADYERSKIKAGDIICSIGPSFGKLMITPEALNGANLTQGTARVAISSEYYSRYFFWALRSTCSFQQWESSVGGATFRALNLAPLADTFVVVPSRQEQEKIANFLDHETAKIDTLIEKQQQLITLLKEKRQAVISHAVTKGLNPNAPMRDSGIEWLGEVPEHWAIKRLKHLVIEPLMYGANEAAVDVNKENPRFVRITDVRDDGLLKDDTFRSLNEELAAPYLLSEGDVLLARTGGTVGKSFIYSESWGRCCFAGYLIKASLDQKQVKAEWFYQYTSTQYYWEWIASSQIQATLPNVSADKYNGFLMAVPPVSEQEKILGQLQLDVDRFNDLVEKAQSAIRFMQERRTALISAAVTGKIDVRNWQAPEPLNTANNNKEVAA